MKDTKEKILQTALKLFNRDGLSKVTLRTIALEMNISQGNLNYHFKKRDQIIETLYEQLVTTIDRSMSVQQEKRMTLASLLKISTIIMDSFYGHRFFFLDFVQIMRSEVRIKDHYLKLTEQRQQEFMSIFKKLIKENIIRPELLPNEYKNLYHRIQICGDFWISSAEVVNEKITTEIMTHYRTVITETIYPYLTSKGRKEYQLIMAG